MGAGHVRPPWHRSRGGRARAHRCRARRRCCSCCGEAAAQVHRRRRRRRQPPPTRLPWLRRPGRVQRRRRRAGVRQRKQTRRPTIGEACIRAVEAVLGGGLDGSTQEKALGSHSGASAAPASDKRERHRGMRERLGTAWIRAARRLQGTPWEASDAPVGTEEERQGGETRKANKQWEE